MFDPSRHAYVGADEAHLEEVLADMRNAGIASEGRWVEVHVRGCRATSCGCAAEPNKDAVLSTRRHTQAYCVRHSQRKARSGLPQHSPRRSCLAVRRRSGRRLLPFSYSLYLMQARELGWEVKPFRAPSIVGRVGKRLQGLSAGSAAAMASASSLKILRDLQSRPENKVWRAAQRASIQR